MASPLKRIATMTGVREHTERRPVELWINAEGFVVLRAYNDGGFKHTEINMNDVFKWIASNRHTFPKNPFAP